MTLPTDYEDAHPPSGALTELPATTERGINAINTAINAVPTVGVRSSAVKSKLHGGNIVVKAGYNWRHLWAEWDWDNWIKPQVDRAVNLGRNGVRLISGPRVTTDATISWTAWASSTAYTVDTIATLGGRAYRCTTAGTSHSSGGPTGTGSSISDGTVTWEYVRLNNLAPLTQEEYDSRWTQLARYCATKGLVLYPCLCQIEDFDSLGSGQFQDVDMVASIVTTAAALADFKNIIAFDIFQEGDGRTGRPWAVSTLYGVNSRVNNGGNAYIGTADGTSHSSGGGPTGTGTGISDGTMTWNYNGIPLLPDDVLALTAEIRAVCNVPISFSSPSFDFDGFWEGDEFIWKQVYDDPDGPDYLDTHLYQPEFDAARVMNYAALFHTPAAPFGKPILIGEFGADQTMDSDDQLAVFDSIAITHAQQGVIGSFVWGLADQGYAPIRQLGVWDNTGFVQANELGAGSPLSTTLGMRDDLVAVVRQMVVAQPPGLYEPPNLVTPKRARPPRGVVVTDFTKPGYWYSDTNTTHIVDGRGLGAKCVAGGATSGLLIANTSGHPLYVKADTWYRMVFEVVADTIGRQFDVFVDWYDEGGTLLSRSPGTGQTFRSTDAVNLPVSLECLVKSNVSATRAAPKIRWSAAQATNEVHILRSFTITEA